MNALVFIYMCVIENVHSIQVEIENQKNEIKSTRKTKEKTIIYN